MRAEQPQAGARARRGDRARAGRHRAGADRAREPDRARPPGPAARAAADVGDGGGDRGAARPARARRDLRAADHAPVRHPRVGDRALAARDRGATGCRSTGSRSRPACGAARSRSPRCSSPTRRRSTTTFEAAIRERHRDTLFSARRLDRRRPGRSRCWTAARVAVAESCTGGLMAARLTERGGSSEYMLGGVVAYSNAAKIALADVPAELIERHGAVSPEVAAALADGARARFGADVGIGITGIAGPGGGTEEKPVGTVCLSVAGADVERWDRTVLLPGDRQTIRERTTTVTMHGLRRLLALKLRLFVALDLPEPARAALAAFRAAMADPAVWRPVPDEALHLTLAFLGHRPEADVERIAAVLRGAPATAPRLTLGRALGLPLQAPARADRGDRRPRRDAGGAAGVGEPRAGRRAVSTSPRRGSSARTRRWRGCGPTRASPAAKMPGPAPVTFYGEALTLYRSQLRREGARYEPLARLPLREWSSAAAREARDRSRARGDEERRALGGDDRRRGADAAGRRCARRRRGCAGRAAATSRPSARRCACRSTAPARRPGAVRLRVARYSPPSRRPTLLYLSGGPGGRGRGGVLRRAVRGRRAVEALRPRLLRPARHRRLGPAALPAARARRRACARPRPARTARRAWARGAPSTRRATRSRTSRRCAGRWAWTS